MNGDVSYAGLLNLLGSCMAYSTYRHRADRVTSSQIPYLTLTELPLFMRRALSLCAVVNNANSLFCMLENWKYERSSLFLVNMCLMTETNYYGPRAMMINFLAVSP